MRVVQDNAQAPKHQSMASQNSRKAAHQKTLTWTCSMSDISYCAKAHAPQANSSTNWKCQATDQQEQLARKLFARPANCELDLYDIKGSLQ
jgi:hypothetical protein